MRAAVGVSLIVQGLACFAAESRGAWIWMLGALAVVTGASLLIGFLTPICGCVAALLGAGLAVSPPIANVPGSVSATIFAVLMAIAVVLLGPGAFSLDARLFGRREIVIPP